MPVWVYSQFLSLFRTVTLQGQLKTCKPNFCLGQVESFKTQIYAGTDKKRACVLGKWLKIGSSVRAKGD